MKICKKCQVEKPSDDFYDKKGGRGGKDTLCKCCKIEYLRQWQRENPSKFKASNKKHYNNWYKQNKDHRRNTHRVWLNNNKEKMNKYYREYRKESYSKNISLRIANRIRVRLWRAMRGIRKIDRFGEYTGCTKEFLVEHLESKFQSEMSWSNYGQWHIDHIKPLSSFNLSDPEQLKQACHYTNLQPLWAVDNLKKGNRLL